MEKAGIKDIKNNLSSYLKQVKNGEEILITERGKPIARIIKETPSGTSLHLTLAPLIQKGLVKLPSLSIHKMPASPVSAPGKSAAEMVTEDRR